MTRPLARLIDAASTLFVAWPVCALVWAVDAGREAIDVGGRWARITDPEGEDS